VPVNNSQFHKKVKLKPKPLHASLPAQQVAAAAPLTHQWWHCETDSTQIHTRAWVYNLERVYCRNNCVCRPKSGIGQRKRDAIIFGVWCVEKGA